MAGIKCKNISKTYSGGTKALRNVSFGFSGNGIVSIIGRNGAGKTTLTRILATELMPSTGHASISDINIIKDPDLIREVIAIVPQESRPIPWLTCRQAIVIYLLYRGFGYREASSRAYEALKKVGIEQYADRLTRRLSGGTKRKLTVATVLASDAKVIFLDEPTTGLDPISRIDLWNMLEALKKDYLIFLTTHYLEEAERLADKIGIMEKGQLLAFGSMNALRDKVSYEYSIRIMDARGGGVKTRKGVSIRAADGTHQIMTSKEEAFEISTKLIKQKARFSSNPVSLEDIFYYIVKKPISLDEVEGNEKK